jgi:hypothetical protein
MSVNYLDEIQIPSILKHHTIVRALELDYNKIVLQTDFIKITDNFIASCLHHVFLDVSPYLLEEIQTTIL